MCGKIGNCFRTIIVAACSIALILQLINFTSCNFVFKGAEDGSGTTINFGLWSMGINGECTMDKSFGDYSKDNHILMNARNCQVTSFLAGAIATLMVFLELTKCNIMCGYCIENILFSVAWINASAVYMVFGMTGCGNYIEIDELQDGLDNITAVADQLEKLENNPAAGQAGLDLDFGIEEVLDSFGGRDKMNLTEIIPSFLENIPFGSECQWGQGATFNVIACLVYFACGILLCITPRPSPIWGDGIEDDAEDLALTPSVEKTNLSTQDPSNWSTSEVGQSERSAKIV